LKSPETHLVGGHYHRTKTKPFFIFISLLLRVDCTNLPACRRLLDCQDHSIHDFGCGLDPRTVWFREPADDSVAQFRDKVTGILRIKNTIFGK